MLEVGTCEVTNCSLEDLLAERDIRNQIFNYSRAQDRCDTDLFMSVCHPDCFIDYGGNGGPQGSAKETIELFNNNHRNWAAHTHQVTNISIRVREDKAVSESYVNAVLRGKPDEEGNAVDFHARGRYLDQWSKYQGRWVLSHRTLVSEFAWSQDVVNGQLAARGNPSRDRNDPVYSLFASLN